MAELLLTLAGNPGSGKSTVARHLAELYEVPVISGSEILEEWAAERGLELAERSDYADFHFDIRRELGNACLFNEAWGRRTINGMVFDGTRNIVDFMAFQTNGVPTAALWCPFDERLERARLRGDYKTREAFRADEFAEYDDPDPRKIHTLRIMNQSKYMIRAEKPLGQVLARAEQIAELSLR